MKTTKSTKKPVTYTYQSADGSTFTLEAGKDGVTKKLIQFLEESDRKADLDERYEAEQLDWKFRNAQITYEEQGDLLEDSPLERIADPDADIAAILFPEAEEDSLPLARLEEAIEQLTESQKDLVHELYGLRKSMSEVAREQGVSLTAIQNRRGKILRQLGKLAKIG